MESPAVIGVMAFGGYGKGAGVMHPMQQFGNSVGSGFQSAVGVPLRKPTVNRALKSRMLGDQRLGREDSDGDKIALLDECEIIAIVWTLRRTVSRK